MSNYLEKNRSFLFAALMLCILLLSACAQAVEKQPTWQEQYELGIRYLSESNYEEAIIAFTVAIEIDPKLAMAYVGRGDAYILSGETAESLEAALADYEAAITLDEGNVDAWLGVADIYVRMGENSHALDVLKEALRKIGENNRITEKIEILENDAADTNDTTYEDVYYNYSAIPIFEGDNFDYWIYGGRSNTVQTEMQGGTTKNPERMIGYNPDETPQNSV